MVYKVAVRTPLGRFTTDISMDILDDNRLVGSFVIMGLESSFEGTIDQADKVSFNGNINTPIGELEYDAIGEISGDEFHGKAKTRVGEFEFLPAMRKKRK